MSSEKLYQMIDEDIEEKRNIIVMYEYMQAIRMAWFIQANIKDRLGTLEYDRILEGRFDSSDESVSTVRYLDFITDSGEKYEYMYLYGHSRPRLN